MKYGSQIGITNLINLKPKSSTKNELTLKLNELRISDWINELIQDERFQKIKEELIAIKKNVRKLDFQERIEELRSLIRKTLKFNYTNLDYIDITGINLYDPKYVLLKYKYGQIKFKREFERDVIHSAKTSDILNEISDKYYNGDELLIAFLPDGRILPLEEIHHVWLKKAGYFVDSFIFIAPQKYVGELAPLLDQISETRLKFELDRFLNKITYALNNISFKELVYSEDGTLRTRILEIQKSKVLIKEDEGNRSYTKKKLYGSYALSVLFGMNEAFLKTTIDRIHIGSQMGITEDSLFLIKSELYYKIFQIEDKIEDFLQEIDNAVNDYLKAIYNSQYSENPMYFTILELSASLRNLLYKAELISTPTYEGLGELNLESRMLNNLRSIVSKHKSKKNENVITNLWIELYAELIDKYGDILRSKNLINVFNFAFENLFNEIQTEIIPFYAENTIRGEFIKEILKIFPDNMFISSGSLSYILFKDKLYLNRKFLIEERINLAVDSVIYERIEENILELELGDFNFFITLLSEDQLRFMKKKIIETINVFKRFYSGDKTSIKEEFTKKIFEQLFNNPNSPYRDIEVVSAWPDWLIGPNGRGLELDGLVEEADFAFEMNGPYHNNPKLISKMFNIPLAEAKKKVQAVQEKDQIKIDECKIRGIRLLILDYNMDFEEIVEICCKFYADLLNNRNIDEKIDWRDFHIDWKKILEDIKKKRMENLIWRFNIRNKLDDSEVLQR